MKDMIQTMVEHFFYDLPNDKKEFENKLEELKDALVINSENEFTEFAKIFKNPEMLGKIPGLLKPATVSEIRLCLLEIMNDMITEHSNNKKIVLDLNIWNFDDIIFQLHEYVSDSQIVTQDRNEYTKGINHLYDIGDIYAALGEEYNDQDEPEYPLYQPFHQRFNEVQLDGIRLGLSREDVRDPAFGEHTVDAASKMVENGTPIADAAAILRGLTFDDIFDMVSAENQNQNQIVDEPQPEINIVNNAAGNQLQANLEINVVNNAAGNQPQANVDNEDANYQPVLNPIQLEGVTLGFTINQVNYPTYGQHTINAANFLICIGKVDDIFEDLAAATIDDIDFTVEALGGYQD